MHIEDIERRITLAFAMTIYYHVTPKEDYVLMLFGALACFVFPIFVGLFVGKAP